MDINTNAFRIVSSLTDENKGENRRSSNAKSAGKLGGVARAKSLPRERQREIAVNAIRSRWSKQEQK